MLHILAFTCLALLGSAAYPRLSALKLVIGLSAFGGLIEVVQLIPSLHRDTEVLDWVADTAAVVAIVLTIHVWRRAQLAKE
jgi:VanZ family protein